MTEQCFWLAVLISTIREKSMTGLILVTVTILVAEVISILGAISAAGVTRSLINCNFSTLIVSFVEAICLVESISELG